MRSIDKFQTKSASSWPYIMAYIWTLGNGREGHFTEGNRGKKAKV